MASAMNALVDERNDERLKLLVGVMLHQFGGLQEFLVAWDEYRERAMERGGFAARRCIELVVRLLQYCDARRPDPDLISDEELQAHLREQLKDLVRQYPDLAVAAARDVGWTVTPV